MDKLNDYAADLDVIASVLTGDNETITPEQAAKVLAQIAADLRTIARSREGNKAS